MSGPTLSQQAHAEALKTTQAEKPQQFTVGAYVDEHGKFHSTATYDRTWKNAWGLTAYAKAYWNDLSVTPHPKLEAGVEVRKKF